MAWEFGVGPRTGTAPTVAVTSGITARTFARRLVGPDEAAFRLNGRLPVAGEVAEYEDDVWVRRDGVLVGRCRVVSCDDTADHTRHMVGVKAVGYEALLATRFTDAMVTYTAADQAEIVWQLVNMSQGRTNGALGITKGTSGFTAGVANTGVLRDRSYEPYKSCLTLIRQLAEVTNGFDWEIDPGKLLQVYYPARGVAAGKVLQYGGNIVGFRRTFNWGQFGNAGTVTGASGVQPVTFTAAGLATDPRGRVEVIGGYPSVITPNGLLERASAFGVERGRPSIGWALDYRRGAWGGFGEVNVGDTVTWVCQSLPRVNLNVSVRVHEIAVKIDEAGAEDVTVKVEQL